MAATTRTTFDDEMLMCTFCGKRQDEVAKLIAGPGVFICDVCVDLCNTVIAEEILGSLRDPDRKSDDELLQEMVGIHASHRSIDSALADVVQRLRARNVSWARIGEALGMTRQSAWERFSGEE